MTSGHVGSSPTGSIITNETPGSIPGAGIMIINITPEVKQDVIDQLEDLKKGQPHAHTIVYEEIIELIKKTELTKVYDI